MWPSSSCGGLTPFFWYAIASKRAALDYSKGRGIGTALVSEYLDRVAGSLFGDPSFGVICKMMNLFSLQTCC